MDKKPQNRAVVITRPARLRVARSINRARQLHPGAGPALDCVAEDLARMVAGAEPQFNVFQFLQRCGMGRWPCMADKH